MAAFTLMAGMVMDAVASGSCKGAVAIAVVATVAVAVAATMATVAAEVIHLSYSEIVTSQRSTAMCETATKNLHIV